MDQGQHRILTTLDNPFRIVIFTPLELLLLVGPVFMSMAMNGWLSLVVAVSGIPLRKRVVRLQRKYSTRQIQGMVYWHLPPSAPKGDVRLPLSYVREYVA